MHTNESQELETPEYPFSQFSFLHPLFKNHSGITPNSMILTTRNRSLGPAESAFLGSLLEMQGVRPHPRLTGQSLPFHKISGWQVHVLKFEKHYSVNLLSLMN